MTAGDWTSIVFPRFSTDITSYRRTLFHSCVPYSVGDKLILSGHENAPRGIPAAVVRVDRVRLRQLSAADLDMLGGIGESAYLARWDAVNPQCLSADDPEVWRVEFKYER